MLRFQLRKLLNKALQTTRLSNGVRVVTDQTPGHFSALGTFVDAGSRYEDEQDLGHTHVLDRLAWKLTSSRSGQQMMQDLAKLGGNFMSGALRELVVYQASCFNKDLPAMLDCMTDTVRNPQLLESEIEESKQTVDFELGEMFYKHDVFLPEVLHLVAYDNRTLGVPMYGEQGALQNITTDSVHQFYQKFYRPDSLVLAMVGVDHEQAVKMAEAQLGDWQLPEEPKSKPQKAEYVGGFEHLPFQQPLYANLPELVYLQVAFQTGGLLSEDLYPLALLQKLLGGGSSFSAGGPGKGMFSRLFTLLCHHQYVENCLAFNHAYTDLGLFGITISAYRGFEPQLAQIVAGEFQKLLQPGNIDAKELQRAKNQLVSSLLMNGESKLAQLEDIGRQVQCQNKITSVSEMVTRIEVLSAEDLQKTAEKVFSGQGNGPLTKPPTVVMQGDRELFGDIEFHLRHSGLGAWDSPAPQEPRAFPKRLSRLAKWLS